MTQQVPDDKIKKRAKKVVDAGSLPLAELQERIETTEAIAKIAENTIPKDVQKIEVINPKLEVSLAGIEILTIKGDKGDKGDKGEAGLDGTNGVDGIDGKDGVPGKDGKDGRDGKDGEKGDPGEPGAYGKDGKDGSPDTPDQVVDKVNSSTKQIKQERVEGLTDLVTNVAHGAISSLPATTMLVNGVRAKNLSVSGSGVTVSTSGDTATLSITGGGGSGNVVTLSFVIDGGGSAITTGIKGDIICDFACTINSVTLLADQSGSIVVDIWKDTYANYPPTVADTITASAKPTITTATKSQDTTLTGWTTSIAAGDTIRYNVDSASTVTRVLVSLKVTKT